MGMLFGHVHNNYHDAHPPLVVHMHVGQVAISGVRFYRPHEQPKASLVIWRVPCPAHCGPAYGTPTPLGTPLVFLFVRMSAARRYRVISCDHAASYQSSAPSLSSHVSFLMWCINVGPIKCLCPPMPHIEPPIDAPSMAT